MVMNGSPSSDIEETRHVIYLIFYPSFLQRTALRENNKKCLVHLTTEAEYCLITQVCKRYLQIICHFCSIHNLIMFVLLFVTDFYFVDVEYRVTSGSCLALLYFLSLSLMAHFTPLSLLPLGRSLSLSLSPHLTVPRHHITHYAFSFHGGNHFK